MPGANNMRPTAEMCVGVVVSRPINAQAIKGGRQLARTNRERTRHWSGALVAFMMTSCQAAAAAFCTMPEPLARTSRQPHLLQPLETQQHARASKLSTISHVSKWDTSGVMHGRCPKLKGTTLLSPSSDSTVKPAAVVLSSDMLAQLLVAVSSTSSSSDALQAQQCTAGEATSPLVPPDCFTPRGPTAGQRASGNKMQAVNLAYPDFSTRLIEHAGCHSCRDTWTPDTAAFAEPCVGSIAAAVAAGCCWLLSAQNGIGVRSPGLQSATASIICVNHTTTGPASKGISESELVYDMQHMRAWMADTDPAGRKQEGQWDQQWWQANLPVSQSASCVLLSPACRLQSAWP